MLVWVWCAIWGDVLRVIHIVPLLIKKNLGRVSTHEPCASQRFYLTWKQGPEYCAWNYTESINSRSQQKDPLWTTNLRDNQTVLASSVALPARLYYHPGPGLMFTVLTMSHQWKVKLCSIHLFKNPDEYGKFLGGISPKWYNFKSLILKGMNYHCLITCFLSISSFLFLPMQNQPKYLWYH